MSTKLTADLNAVQNAPIELEYLNGDLNIIQKLDDEPNDVGGLSSAQLKAKFDEAGNSIKNYINNELIPAILATDATEIARTEAETARETAEQARKTAEAQRDHSEQERESSEEARARAETARSNAESTRSASESARDAAENARATAESQRAQAEAAREAAEDARAQAETAREAAEDARATAESGRSRAEERRASAEDLRAAAEMQRHANETARQNAENARNVWGDYEASKSYAAGNKVASAGSSYVCIKACRGIAPPNAEYWQLIAQKGNDGKGAPSDNAPKAPGTANAGGEETYSRSDHVHPKELPNGGSAGQVLTKTASGSKWGDVKKLSYYMTFTSAQWTQGDAEATMRILKSTHELSGNDVFAQTSILTNGVYRKGTWAGLETYAVVESNGDITLHTPEAFDGAVLLIG